MTVKGVVRYLIALVISILLFTLLLPLVGVPRAQIFPPAFVYGNATGKAQGVVVKTYKEDHPSPFKVGVRVPKVDYAFTAPYTPLLLADPKSDPKKKYTGTVWTDENLYGKLQVGQRVPVRYASDYPVISGIDLPGGGRSTAAGSALLSAWIAWTLGYLGLAWVISPLLERLFLRESY